MPKVNVKLCDSRFISHLQLIEARHPGTIKLCTQEEVLDALGKRLAHFLNCSSRTEFKVRLETQWVHEDDFEKIMATGGGVYYKASITVEGEEPEWTEQ